MKTRTRLVATRIMSLCMGACLVACSKPPRVSDVPKEDYLHFGLMNGDCAVGELFARFLATKGYGAEIGYIAIEDETVDPEWPNQSTAPAEEDACIDEFKRVFGIDLTKQDGWQVRCSVIPRTEIDFAKGSDYRQATAQAMQNPLIKLAFGKHLDLDDNGSAKSRVTWQKALISYRFWLDESFRACRIVDVEFIGTSPIVGRFMTRRLGVIEPVLTYPTQSPSTERSDSPNRTESAFGVVTP